MAKLRAVRVIAEDDIIDAAQVAPLIGLANANGVHVYARRYDDFPEPFKRFGHCLLWRREDVQSWSAKRSSSPSTGS